MPANIFVAMVQALRKNLGLAGFVALGRGEVDRNPGFLSEQPCFLQSMHTKCYHI